MTTVTSFNKLSFAKCLGCAPLSFEHKTLNKVLLTCCLLANQIRIMYALYVHIKQICYATTPFIHGTVLTAAILVHDVFISIWIYRAINELEIWKIISKQLIMRNGRNNQNTYLCISCYICYFILFIYETRTYIKTPYEQIYVWFNFHLSQNVNYFLIFLMQHLVGAMGKKYEKFEKEFEKQIKNAIFKTVTLSMTIICKEMGTKYKILYDCNRKFNEVFGLSLITAISLIFLNTLCGIGIFTQRLPEDLFTMHLKTFIMQFIIALVSTV